MKIFRHIFFYMERHLFSKRNLIEILSSTLCSNWNPQLMVSCVNFLTRSDSAFGLKHGNKFAYGRVSHVTDSKKYALKNVYFYSSLLKTLEKLFQRDLFFRLDYNTLPLHRMWWKSKKNSKIWAETWKKINTFKYNHNYVLNWIEWH